MLSYPLRGRLPEGPRGGDQVLQGRPHLLPGSCLQAAIRIDPDLPILQPASGKLQQRDHLRRRGHSRAVNVPDPWPDFRRIGVIGAYDSVGIIDQIIFSGGDAASLLIQKGGIFNGDFSYYLAGFAVYFIVGVTAIYAMFLLALSKIALSILLALGPLFIALLFFETTKRFFESWIAQLANYAFITILTVMVSALMMGIVSSAAQQAAELGGSISIADAVRVCMAAGLTLLIMRQVMPMAAGLASGLALSSFGLVSAALAWGFGNASRHSGQFGRGLIDRETTRWDPLSRKAGYYLSRGAGLGARRLARVARPNTIARG